MKRTVISTLLCLWIVSLSAQQPSRSEITNSGNYYYGTGISSDENQARDEAIREISEQIAVKVSSEFEMKAKETNKKFEETATSIIKTYSMATLSEVETLRSVTPDGKTELFCYVNKDQVRKLFDERKALVYNMYQNGRENEQSGNLFFALKNFYFGAVLLNSIPGENITESSTNLTIEIPKAINTLLKGIRFEVTDDTKLGDKEREVNFAVTYNNKPVSLMQYRFWDGTQVSGNAMVRDGKTTIALMGSSIDFDRLKIYPEYEFFNARKEYTAVEQLWDLVVRPEFENAINVDLKKSAAATKNATSEVTVPKGTQLVLKYEKPCPAADQVLLSANRFVAALENGTQQYIQGEYAKDTFLLKKIIAYIEHNQPKPVRGETEAVVYETRLGYEVRKMEVLHTYPSMHKQSTEFLVLDFDKNGQLTDFNLCITDDLYEKFVEQATYGNDWGNRQEIIKFIEKYRTAYLTRDINTIGLMFAEEALILIGRKIETRKKTAGDVAYTQLPGQPEFEQLQLTKQQYLTRQKQIFDYQQDIFLDFSTFEIIKKNNSPGVYGVEMRQNYSSTTYADEGYLFLLIDFNEKDPLIYIRAWQPNEWDPDALVNTSNFRIYK